MDLISTLASTLNIDAKQAQAVAGTVLGGVKSQVAENVDADTAKKFDAQVPELGGWQATAGQLLGGGQPAAPAAGGGGLLGGLMGAAAQSGLMGKQAKDIGAVVSVLDRFGVDKSKAALVAPVILDFLKKKLDPSLMEKVLMAAPMLAALKGGAKTDAPAAPGGGAGGLLGGLGGLLG